MLAASFASAFPWLYTKKTVSTLRDRTFSHLQFILRDSVDLCSQVISAIYIYMPCNHMTVYFMLSADLSEKDKKRYQALLQWLNEISNDSSLPFNKSQVADTQLSRIAQVDQVSWLI